MKEKLTQEENNGGIKRGKIFEVLNKKRKPDNTLFDNGKNEKNKVHNKSSQSQF